MKNIYLVVLMWAVVVLGQIPFIGEQDWFNYFADGLFFTLLVIPVLVLFPLLILKLLFGFNSGLYKIKKGNHYSGYRFKPFKEKDPTAFGIILYDGWDAAPVNGQINKLVGKNWGWPNLNMKKGGVHKNSLRVGMKLAGHGTYDIFYYGYHEGKRFKSVFIGNVKKNERFQVEVSKEIFYKVINGNNKKAFTKKKDQKKIEILKTNFGYYLFPYHGGRVKARATCKVDVYKYKKRIHIVGVRFLRIPLC